MTGRFSARTTSGRRGLLWAALALLLVLIVADLARGPGSLLRGVVTRVEPRPSPPERLFDRVFDR